MKLSNILFALKCSDYLSRSCFLAQMLYEGDNIICNKYNLDCRKCMLSTFNLLAFNYGENARLIDIFK